MGDLFEKNNVATTFSTYLHGTDHSKGGEITFILTSFFLGLYLEALVVEVLMMFFPARRRVREKFTCQGFSQKVHPSPAPFKT